MKPVAVMAWILLLLGTSVFAQSQNFQLDDRFNLNGDVIYLPKEAAFATGTGINLASFYKQVFLIRGEYVFAHKDGVTDKAGVGLGVDLVKGLRSLGVTWLPEKLNPAVGALLLVDLKDQPDISYGVYLTVIKLEF